MWMIFEDADGTCISKLIKDAYANTDLTLKFAGGHGNFFDIASAAPMDECVIIMLDLIPDNPYTSKAYKMLTKRLRHRKGAYVLPTLSMDYMLLKAFTTVDTSPESLMLKGYSFDSRVTSLEKLYKYLLDNSSECLSLGRFTQISEITGRFYTDDCLCGYDSSRCNGCYSRRSKGLDLLYSMPCFYDIDCNKPSCRFDVNRYITEAIKEHNRLVTVLYENGILNQKDYDMTIIHNIRLYS